MFINNKYCITYFCLLYFDQLQMPLASTVTGFLCNYDYSDKAVSWIILFKSGGE